MNCLMHFASSSNGDNWFLGTDDITHKNFVLHRGNPSSGGHETISDVQVFLEKRPFGPERDALLAMLAVRDNAPPLQGPDVMSGVDVETAVVEALNVAGDADATFVFVTVRATTEEIARASMICAAIAGVAGVTNQLQIG